MMNPATGLPEDDYPPELPGGAISQQERDAMMAPTFSSGPPPIDLGPGPDEVMPMSPDAETEPPPLPTGDALASLGPDQIGPPEMPSVTESPVSDVGTEGMAPAPGPAITSPLADDYGNPMPPSGLAGETAPSTGAPDAAKPVEAPAPLSPVDQITADRIKTAEQEGVLKEKRAEIEQRRADAELERKIQAQKETDALVARAEARLAESNARRQAEYDRFRDMSVKDSWGDHGTALRVMAGIAMLLGGRAGAGAYVVGASQGLEENKRTQLALQEKRMEAAGKSHEEAKAQTAEEFANFKMRQAAALDVTATRAEQELRAQGVDEAKIATNKETQQIRAAAEAGKIEARKLAAKEQEQKLKDELAKHAQQTKDDLAKSQIELNKARVGKLGKGKGAGGGGGSNLATRAQAVADAITNGVEEDGKRRELTPGEKMAIAKANGIPLNGKSSETTLDSINKMSAFDANSARKAAGKGGTGDTKAIDDSFKPFRIEAIGTPRSPGPVAELTKIEEMRRTLAEAGASGDSDKIKTAMVKAKEQAGTLMSGGKMTVGQMKIMGELNSTIDDLSAHIGKWTGNPTEGAGAVRRLTNLIETAGDESANRVKLIREGAMTQHLGPGGRADTPEKKRAFESAEGGVFGRVEWNGKRLFQEGERSAGLNGAPAGDAKAYDAQGKGKGGPPSTGRDPATESLISEMRAAAAPGSGVSKERRTRAIQWLMDSGIPLR